MSSMMAPDGAIAHVLAPFSDIWLHQLPHRLPYPCRASDCDLWMLIMAMMAKTVRTLVHWTRRCEGDEAPCLVDGLVVSIVGLR